MYPSRYDVPGAFDSAWRAYIFALPLHSNTKWELDVSSRLRYGKIYLHSYNHLGQLAYRFWQSLLCQKLDILQKLDTLYVRTRYIL